MGKTTGGSNLNGDYSQVVGVGVTLTIGSDIKDFCITTSATCSSTEWKSATTTPSITLPNTEGNKTYNAYVRDNANNVSGKATDSIFLDLTNPSVSKVTYVSKDISSITVNVTGSDETTGSGIVKYECKATSQSAWFTQDESGNCKVTGLNDNTSYTIEGRVTDASGRVSTNSVSTTQSTEAAYSCSAGEELVQDSQKGSSSGGYICKASASSKGWYTTTTYWTCNEIAGSKYDSRGNADSACEFAVKTECSTLEYPIYVQNENANVHSLWGNSVNEVKEKLIQAGWTISSCTYDRPWYTCGLLDGKGHEWESISRSSMSSCSSECKFETFIDRVGPVYRCPITNVLYRSSSSCYSSCGYSGTVTSREERDYYCDSSSGWDLYSGSDSTLQCFKPATKG